MGRGRRSRRAFRKGHRFLRCSANVYLHYVFDLWANQWRTRHARGDVVIVRFADDVVVGFEHRDDAERFWADLRDRLAKFSLELNAEKTRLIEIGRYAAERRTARGLGKPETFAFLGFTHACGKTRKGRFKLKRTTDSKRMRAKLNALKGKIERATASAHSRARALASQLLRGHYQYYAVPDNSEALRAFRRQVVWHWLQGAPASQPAHHNDLGADVASRRSMATIPRGPARLARTSDSPPIPKAEPSAVILHAGICAGGSASPIGRRRCPYRDRRTSSASRTGSGPGAARITRWMRSLPGSWRRR